MFWTIFKTFKQLLHAFIIIIYYILFKDALTKTYFLLQLGNLRLSLRGVFLL